MAATARLRAEVHQRRKQRGAPVAGTDVSTLIAQGRDALARNDVVRATQCFEEVTRREPVTPVRRLYVVWARFLGPTPTERPRVEVADVRRALVCVLDTDTFSSFAHYVQGRLHLLAREFGRAERAFRTALHLDAGHLNARRYLRFVLARRGACHQP